MGRSEKSGSAGLDFDSGRTLEEIRALAAGIEPGGERQEAQSPAACLRAFQVFVLTHSHVLRLFPQELVPLARNHSRDGCVAEQAASRAERLDRPWIARDPRPSAASLRPARMLTVAALGHKIAVAADGAVATSTDSGNLYVWSVSSGQLLQTLNPGFREISAIALSQDGRTAVAAEGSPDPAAGKKAGISVWDLNLGACLRVLDGPLCGIRRITLSGDGKTAASVDRDGTVQAWDVIAGSCLRTLPGRANCVALTEDGRMLLAGGADGSVGVWDLSSGEPARILRESSAGIEDVSVSADGRTAWAADRNTFYFWAVNSGACLRRVQVQSGKIERVALTPDGKMGISVEGRFVLSSGNRRWEIPSKLYVWDIASGERIRPLARGVYDAALTADGRIALSVGIEGIDVWDVAAPTELTSDQEGQEVGAIDAIESPDGGRLILPAWNDLRICDVPSGETRSLEGHTDGINSAALSPDGSLVTSGSFDGTVRVWGVSSGAWLRVKSGGYGNVVAFNADGRIALCGNRRLDLWDLARGKLRGSLSAPDDAGDLTAVAVAPDDKTLLAAYQDLVIRLWDMTGSVRKRRRPDIDDMLLESDERLLRSLAGHEHLIVGLALTPDGRTAISSSVDGTLRVWDLVSGVCSQTLEGHTGVARRVSVTRDGQTALSAGEDRTIRIWDLTAGRCTGVHYAGRKVIGILAIKPDGRLACLTTGSEIQHLMLRCVPQGPPLVTAVRLFRFELTRADRIAGMSAASPLFNDGQQMPGRYEHRVTAWCPWCGRRFEIPRPVAAAIGGITNASGLLPNASPCLELDAEAWKESALFSECPLCGRGLRFNPFIVDHLRK